MKVLCAVDGSPSSDAALRLIGELLAPDADKVILYYSPPQVVVRGASAPSAEVVEQAGAALVEKVFDHSRAQLPSQLAEHSTAVTGQQKPRVGIPAATKVHRPDLIVVGARGTNRFGLPRLGSVSRSVVHSANVPVLVARERVSPVGQPLQTLLCCDRTDWATPIGSFLCQLSFPDGAVGRVIHVTESPFGDGLPEWLKEEARLTESDPSAKAYVQQHDAEVKSWMDEIAAHCGELPTAFHGHEPVVLEGQAGERIVDFAESENTDLIIVGAHVSNTLTRMFAGSTSERVLAHAHCSVLIVPHYDAP